MRKFGVRKVRYSKKVEKSFFQRGPAIVLLALLCTILWGTAYPAVKIGYNLFAIDIADGFGKLLFAGLRFTLAGLMTLIVSVVLQKRLIVPQRRYWGGILQLGLGSNYRSIYFLLFRFGQYYWCKRLHFICASYVLCGNFRTFFIPR